MVSLNAVRDVLRVNGIRLEDAKNSGLLAKLLRAARPRKFKMYEKRRIRGWLTISYVRSYMRIGSAESDPVTFRIPKEIGETMAKTKLLQVHIPSELHTWLKEFAARNGVTITHIVTSVITQIKQESDKKNPDQPELV